MLCAPTPCLCAATRRIAFARLGRDAVCELEESDRRSGYLFVDAPTARLEAYEADRERFPALIDFYPEWMKVLEELA